MDLLSPPCPLSLHPLFYFHAPVFLSLDTSACSSPSHGSRLSKGEQSGGLTDMKVSMTGRALHCQQATWAALPPKGLMVECLSLCHTMEDVWRGE